jgi:hypothetical protein
MRECFCVVKSRALIATLGDKPGFVARDIPIKVGFNLTDPHVVYDRMTCWEVNEFPRAVGQE